MIHNNTSTSIAAAVAIQPSAAIQRRQVLDAIRAAGIHGLTRQELERTGIRPDSLRPRCAELIAAGLIEESGEIRATESGRAAKVLTVLI